MVAAAATTTNMNDQAALFPVLNTAKVKRPTETDRRLPIWLSKPIQFPAINLLESSQSIDDFAPHLDNNLLRYMKRTMLVERMFPVQRALIPFLMNEFKSRPYRRPNDICVSSPTGSGKTLAFAAPIVSHLKQTLGTSLRALVVLPSRDLALQVNKVFQQLCTPTHLKCALATGEAADCQKPLFHKIRKSVDHEPDVTATTSCSILQSQFRSATESEVDEYVSTIDILISTPGVLVDLLHKGAGFSLKNLEILVIDEADRLMTSLKHDWLNLIERSVLSNISPCACNEGRPNGKRPKHKAQHSKRQRVCFSSTVGCSMRYSHTTEPLHKLLFSATLSSDPQLLKHMNLFQPRLFLATRPSIASAKIRHSLGSAQSTPTGSPAPSYSPTVNTRNELLTSSAIPEQLEEKMFITEAKEKLFIIWYLFHELKYKKVICFTNLLTTSAQLCAFLNELPDVRAVEFSSNLNPEIRQKYIHEFHKGRVDVLVSTDLMARGMDLEGVEYVISYDMPSSEVFYVHRVGRTARAGKTGTAITFVDTKQLVQFKKIVQLAHKMPNSMRLSDVIEELSVPRNIKRDNDKYDLYMKTLENYEDSWRKIQKNKSH